MPWRYYMLFIIIWVAAIISYLHAFLLLSLLSSLYAFKSLHVLPLLHDFQWSLHSLHLLLRVITIGRWYSELEIDKVQRSEGSRVECHAQGAEGPTYVAFANLNKHTPDTATATGNY